MLFRPEPKIPFPTFLYSFPILASCIQNPVASGHKTIYEAVRIVLPVPDYRQGQALEPGCDVKELVVLAALEQAPGDLARHDDHRDEGTESNPGHLFQEPMAEVSCRVCFVVKNKGLRTFAVFLDAQQRAKHLLLLCSTEFLHKFQFLNLFRRKYYSPENHLFKLRFQSSTSLPQTK